MRILFFAVSCILLTGCSEMGGASPSQGSRSTNELPGLRSFSRQGPITPLAGTSYKVVYSFAGPSDGSNPNGLIAVSGTLYGTTVGGGADGGGTVIAITSAGKERVVYSFHKNTRDGSSPYAPLLESSGTFYGTTSSGGTAYGYGTVFSVTKAGVEHVLYRFKGGEDGENPDSALVELNGVMYGTTPAGGGKYGNGTVFAIDPAGHERVLFRFTDPRVAQQPHGGLVALNGDLYGTTTYGGIRNGGTVFEISPSGKERVIHSFKANTRDGMLPRAKLIAWNGNLYGTTVAGGGSHKCSDGCGTVFEVTLSGTEKVLYRFQSRRDGFEPFSRLLESKGVLYGTTPDGGNLFCYQGSYKASGCGTVFKLTSPGVETVLHSFKGPPSDGTAPLAGLTSLGGTLYGTTESGGSKNAGTVFRITP
jgi:uncharacterized repeat protein (TIGR03803 family)